MRALIKKELTEVLVPFGLAFVVISFFWIATVHFWDALLPPASDMLAIVALSSALTGAVLGYLQFSSERWRGKLGYLCHRGTGIEGAFLAKVIAGLLGTTMIGLGPPLLYALHAKLFSPNASIIQASVFRAYASAATVGASLYALGALAASLRRRALVGVLMIPVAGAALWVISEFCGTPWGNASSPWRFPLLHIALAAVLLLLVLRMVRSGVDADLPLPRGIHLATVVLAVPLVLFPCDIAAYLLQGVLLHKARSDYPMLVRDRENGGIFPAYVGEDGGCYRLEPGDQVGERLQLGATDPKRGVDTVFWGKGLYGASAPEPPAVPMSVRFGTYGTRGGLTPINITYNYSQDMYADLRFPPVVKVYLDRGRGTIRSFAYITSSRQLADQPDELRRAPFAIEFEKPGSGRAFSHETVVLEGHSEAKSRLLRSIAADDPTAANPLARLPDCLLDPEDGSCWRLDVLDPKVPIARVELPQDDRFLRCDPLFRRSDLTLGHYQDSGDDPVVVGEHGRYSWNGREFVDFVPSEMSVTASEAASLVQCRVVVDDPDPLRCTVRVLDAKDGRELFTYAYAPRGVLATLAAAATQAAVLLRSPLANTLVFGGVIRQELAADPGYQFRSEFLAGGRRPWLWILDLAVGLACAGACARLLRRRNVSPIGIALGCTFVLLSGPAGLLVVWLLEPKGRARALPSAEAVREPALAIQSG